MILKMVKQYLFMTLCIYGICISVKADKNSSDDSGIGIVVSLFSPGHLSLISGNPDFMNMTTLRSGKGVVPIQTYYFNTIRAKIVSMTSDPRNDTLFILDSDSHSIYRMENFNIWLNNSVRIVPLQKGVSKTSAQITYDWYSRNIYWVDGYYNWIGMQPAFTTDNSLYKIIIHKDIKRPEGIAVDPLNGYLFYSDMGSPQRIERCSLTGENRTVILTSGISRVYDIAVDHKERMLYWVDAGRHTLETADYDGRNRRLLTRMNSVKFTSVSVYGEHVYVTSFTSNTVSKINKRTGVISMIIVVDDGTPVGAEIWNPAMTLPISTACESYGCEHMCTHLPSGPKCMCKEGYSLMLNKKSCVDEKLHRGFVLANSTHICNLDIRQLTALKEEMFCYATNLSGIMYLAIDTADQSIFYVDSQLHMIMQYSLVFNGTISLTETGPNVTGFAYDWIDRNVIWSEIDQLHRGTIRVHSIDSGATSNIYKNLINPTYVNVNPLTRSLYWIEGREKNYSIKSGNLDGSASKVIVQNKDLRSPTGLYYHIEKNLLFWINWDSIRSCKTDGSDIISHLNTISVLFFGVELVVYKDHAIWTHGKSFFMTASIFRNSIDVKVDTRHFGLLTGMAIYDPYLQEYKRGPCQIMNGGCEQVCLPSGKKAVCKCDYGFKLAPDGKNCSSDIAEKRFLLIADHTHGRIYQSRLSDAKISALDIPNVKKPACVVYHRKNKLVYWVEIEMAGSQIKRADLKGTNSSVIMESALVYPDRIAMDYTTGHIYYTAVSAIMYKSYVGVLHPDRGIHKKLITQLGTPRAIAVHPSEGYMFWTDHNKNSPHIGRAFMDGSSQRVLISKDVVWPNGLAIDYRENRLYWADGHKDRIESIDIHGLNRKLVLEVKNQQLVDIDLLGSYLFYTAWNTQKISKVLINSDGSGKLVDWMSDIPELGRLDSIDIDPGNEQPLSESCFHLNGQCSTFCLPKPNGRTCACEEGNELLANGRTCDGAKGCSLDLPNGNFSSDCAGFPTEKCLYFCNSNYMPHELIRHAQCKDNGEWEVPLDSLCKAKQCKVMRPVRRLLNDCIPVVGRECSYSCHEGYLRNPKIPTISCNSSLKWNHNLYDVCKSIININVDTSKPYLKCRDDIPNGQIGANCQRLPDQSCSFTCNIGFMKKDEDIELTCLSHGKWSVDLMNLCSGIPGKVQFHAAKDTSSSSYTAIWAVIACVIGVVLIALAVAIFIFFKRRRRSTVGRYESHQNVYCEPQKGIINLAADPSTNSPAENNHYAHLSDI